MSCSDEEQMFYLEKKCHFPISKKMRNKDDVKSEGTRRKKAKLNFEFQHKFEFARLDPASLPPPTAILFFLLLFFFLFPFLLFSFSFFFLFFFVVVVVF